MSPGEETNGNLCRRTVGRGRRALRQKNEGDGGQKRRAGRTDDGGKINLTVAGRKTTGWEISETGKKKKDTMKLSNN